MLLHLPHTHKALDVQEAMAAMARLPHTLRRTLTWDQGQEMANQLLPIFTASTSAACAAAKCRASAGVRGDSSAKIAVRNFSRSRECGRRWRSINVAVVLIAQDTLQRLSR